MSGITSLILPLRIRKLVMMRHKWLMRTSVLPLSMVCHQLVGGAWELTVLQCSLQTLPISRFNISHLLPVVSYFYYIGGAVLSGNETER